MMSILPMVVQAADCGGGGVAIGDINCHGITTWMVGRVATHKSIVI